MKSTQKHHQHSNQCQLLMLPSKSATPERMRQPKNWRIFFSNCWTREKKPLHTLKQWKNHLFFFSVHECIVLNVEWISLGEFTSKQEICMFKYYIISQGLHFLLAVELCHRSMPWWHKERKWCDFWCFYIFHMTDKTTPEMMRFVIGFCSCGHQKVFKLIIPN